MLSFFILYVHLGDLGHIPSLEMKHTHRNYQQVLTSEEQKRVGAFKLYNTLLIDTNRLTAFVLRLDLMLLPIKHWVNISWETPNWDYPNWF